VSPSPAAYSFIAGYSFACGAAFGGAEDGHVIGGATIGTCVSRLEGGSWRHVAAPLTSRLHAAAAAAPDRLYLLVCHPPCDSQPGRHSVPWAYHFFSTGAATTLGSTQLPSCRVAGRAQPRSSAALSGWAAAAARGGRGRPWWTRALRWAPPASGTTCSQSVGRRASTQFPTLTRRLVPLPQAAAVSAVDRQPLRGFI